MTKLLLRLVYEIAMLIFVLFLLYKTIVGDFDDCIAYAVDFVSISIEKAASLLAI